MKCRVEKSKISGHIICPSNKSYTHRAIFIASLSDGKSIIKNILKSSDTIATINACKNFGVELTESEDKIIIKNSISSKVDGCIIDACNSGTTIRIAAAIAVLSHGKTVLSGDDSLKKRPMKPILDALESMGAKCSSAKGKPPISVEGEVKGGEVQVSGSISSQFISALMIVAPRLANGLVLNIQNELVSKPYLDMTIATMDKFGINVKTEIPYQKYIIKHQNYKATNFTIPSDFSSLALLLSSAVLLGNELEIELSMGDMPQADEAIIDILEILGVVVTLEKNIIKIKSPEKLTGGKFDLSDSPDLLPAIAILSLKSAKPIKIFNVKHARYKETDRIAILARELVKLGINVIENDDGLILKPAKKLVSATLCSENDHRLFMAFCIAGMYVGDCSITDPESVGISYPNFVSEMKKIGGKIFLDE